MEFSTTLGLHDRLISAGGRIYDQGMDLSASSLLSCLFIGSLGLFLFLYGKRTIKPLMLIIGLAMCTYPYFISNLLVLWLVTGLPMVPL